MFIVYYADDRLTIRGTEKIRAVPRRTG